MGNSNGMEMTCIKPRWVLQQVPKNFAIDKLKDIIIFYVFNTPCENASSSSIPMRNYGWKNNVFKTYDLKNYLYDFAGLERDKSLFFVKKLEEMHTSLRSAQLTGEFHKRRNTEKIVVYKGKDNEIMCIFRHIRNALAHGRIAIYSVKNEIIYVLEDGIVKQNEFEVRARMILKESTLIEWKETIESGKIQKKEYDNEKY